MQDNKSNNEMNDGQNDIDPNQHNNSDQDLDEHLQQPQTLHMDLHHQEPHLMPQTNKAIIAPLTIENIVGSEVCNFGSHM